MPDLTLKHYRLPAETVRKIEDLKNDTSRRTATAVIIEAIDRMYSTDAGRVADETPIT